MHTTLEDFLFTHEYLFRQQTARFYPLSFQLIEQYADTWDFQLLCANPHIRWDVPALEKWEQRIDWAGLSGNKGMTWTEELLDRYADRIDWVQLAQNPSFPFLEPILNKYEARINWIYLSSNPSFPLTDAFLDAYESKIHWPIEISGATGIRFERVWECRPRMLQLEKVEACFENKQILEELRAEYAHQFPEEEQITLRKYREMAAWAETVRSNKGVVKKLYDDNPPVATNDPFLAAIRQKEVEFDAVFPTWFVDMLRKQELPETLSDYNLLPLESMHREEIEADFPITVKSVVFAEYSTQVLFLVLKVGSLHEMDYVIYLKEYDQGGPASIICSMK